MGEWEIKVCGSFPHKCAYPSVALIKKALLLTPDIILFLPRTTNIQNIISLTKLAGEAEIEQNMLDGKVKAISVYFGRMARRSSSSWIDC
jgi:trimethylguanosine synthase